MELKLSANFEKEKILLMDSKELVDSIAQKINFISEMNIEIPQNFYESLRLDGIQYFA